jgi:hypothetical protein
MFARFFAILLIGIFVFSSQVFSLTDSDVKKFIKATSELVPFFEEIDEEDDEDYDENEEPDLDIESITQEFIDGVTGHAEMEKIIRKSGFSSVQEWAEVASKVFLAMATIELDINMIEFDKSMEEMRKESEAMGMTKEQLELYESQVKAAMQQFQNAPQEDIDAVTPHLDELKTIMEWE